MDILICSAGTVGTCGEHCATDEQAHTHCPQCWGAILPEQSACVWCGLPCAPMTAERIEILTQTAHAISDGYTRAAIAAWTLADLKALNEQARASADRAARRRLASYAQAGRRAAADANVTAWQASGQAGRQAQASGQWAG